MYISEQRGLPRIDELWTLRFDVPSVYFWSERVHCSRLRSYFDTKFNPAARWLYSPVHKLHLAVHYLYTTLRWQYVSKTAYFDRAKLLYASTTVSSVILTVIFRSQRLRHSKGVTVHFNTQDVYFGRRAVRINSCTIQYYKSKLGNTNCVFWLTICNSGTPPCTLSYGRSYCRSPAVFYVTTALHTITHTVHFGVLSFHFIT